jgi:hypothetical protein
MVRIKNAITGYFVGPWDFTTPPTDATLELAKYITTVTDDTDETVEDTAFYDGDGTPESDVTGIKKTYSFEGMFDQDDPAMAFIATLEFATGDARKIAFKQVRTDGSVLFGRGTLTVPKVTGGDAQDYALFECTISWDKTPMITPPVSP